MRKSVKTYQRTILQVKLFVSYLIMSMSPIKKKKKNVYAYAYTKN